MWAVVGGAWRRSVRWPCVAAISASVLSRRGMACVVAPKPKSARRRRLLRRVSRPTEVEFQRVLMARVGSSRGWQRLEVTLVDGEEALHVSTSQGPSSGQWLRSLLAVPGDGARCYDGAINNFLQDCRRALRGTKATEPDGQALSHDDVLESSQATGPADQEADQGAEPREMPRSGLDITPPDTPSQKVGRDVFVLSDSEEEANAAALSHGPDEQKPLHRKKSARKKPRNREKSRMPQSVAKFERKRPAPAGWGTLLVRARNMRVHFDGNETLHVPANKESVDMLLTELSPLKGEGRRKQRQHKCSGICRKMLREEDQGRVVWRGHAWQVSWRTADGDKKKTVKGLRVRDTCETVRDTAAARYALRRARDFWNSVRNSAETPYLPEFL